LAGEVCIAVFRKIQLFPKDFHRPALDPPSRASCVRSLCAQRKKIDPPGTQQFGLIAEDVEKINPFLVVREENGSLNTVRYDQVNAMLLNEFLKAHTKMEKQQLLIAPQQKLIERLVARLDQQAVEIRRIRSKIEVSANLVSK
jgi:hypothetical protein